MIGGTEVVAVFVEERVRTYGFEVRTGLTLVTRALGAPEELLAARPYPAVGETSRELLMTTAQGDGHGGLTLQLLLEGAATGDPRLWDGVSLLPGAGPIRRVVHPVDAVFFHGPHFGDRFGIAAAALGALDQGEVEVISACCAGASVFLVVGPGQGAVAAERLRSRFDSPAPGGGKP